MMLDKNINEPFPDSKPECIDQFQSIVSDFTEMKDLIKTKLDEVGMEKGRIFSGIK